MRQVLAAERPSLVVFSGDQITGNNVGANATAYTRLVFSAAAEAATPFATIFGNHDDAPLSGNPHKHKHYARALSATSRRQLLAFERATWPSLSLTCNPLGAGGCPPALAPSASNYALLAQGAAPGSRLALYFLDSGGGTFAEALPPAVTDWLAATAAALGHPPALVFVHIPSPEYAAAAGGAGCQGMAQDGVTPTVGANALLATLQAMGGSVRAVSVGHDHGNADCCPAPGGGNISLCFGRHTGYGGYGDWARGARVFEVAEDASARGGLRVTTHVRMEDGSVNSEEEL